MTKEFKVNWLRVGYKLSLLATIAMVSLPIPALAQSENPTAATSSNTSPSLFSLMLLIIGLIAIGVVAIRGIEPAMIAARRGNNQANSQGKPEEDALVEDEPESKLE